MKNAVFENLMKISKTEEGLRSLHGGKFKALTAYRITKEDGFEKFLMDDSLWDREIKDFTDMLKEAGITEFCYSNKSTLLMDNIVGFDREGYKLDRYVQLKKHTVFGDETVNALVFRLS